MSTPISVSMPGVRDNFDAGSLSWVMGEIREALTKSKTALFDAVTQDADTQGTSLRHAKSFLHQADGALQIVDIDGVAIITETTEDLLERIEAGQLVYIAPTGYVGPDSFTYVVKDSKGLTSTATVTMNVTQANRSPLARDDTFIVSGAVKSNLAVLSNDLDPDGDALKIIALTQPLGNSGSVTIVGSEVVFTPKNAFARDSFTYTISDGKGGQSTATVLLIDP